MISRINAAGIMIEGLNRPRHKRTPAKAINNTEYLEMVDANPFSQKSKTRSSRIFGWKMAKLEKTVLSDQSTMLPFPTFVTVTRGNVPYLSSGVSIISAKKFGLV